MKAKVDVRICEREFVVVEPYLLPEEVIVRGVLTALLARPLRTFALIQQVGPFALVEYEPLDEVDPDIIVATGPDSRVFNKLMLRLQEARRGNLDWQPEQWYRRVAGIVSGLETCLVQMGARAAEMEFVLTWAAEVRDFGRAI